MCIVADSVGSILAYDALCRATKYQSRHGSENSILESDVHNRGKFFRSGMFDFKVKSEQQQVESFLTGFVEVSDIIH